VADNFRAAAATPEFGRAVADPTVTGNPANAPVVDALQGDAPLDLDDSSFLSSVDPVLARPILDAFAGSMSVVFLAAAAALVLGVVAVVMMRELPLRTLSGVEAQREMELADALPATAAPVTVPEQAVPPPDGAGTIAARPGDGPGDRAAPCGEAGSGGGRPATDAG
jgi:hypothetical protein